MDGQFRLTDLGRTPKIKISKQKQRSRLKNEGLYRKDMLKKTTTRHNMEVYRKRKTSDSENESDAENVVLNEPQTRKMSDSENESDVEHVEHVVLSERHTPAACEIVIDDVPLESWDFVEFSET